MSYPSGMKVMLIMAALVAFSATGTASKGALPRLLPDLALWIDCSQPPRNTDEIAIEKRLYNLGFDVLNEAKAPRSLGSTWPVDVVAMDPKGSRIVLVNGRLQDGTQPDGKLTLSISLLSRPATPKDASLEKNVEGLWSGVPTCVVRKLDRNTNSPSVGSIYDQLLKVMEGQFTKAPADARRVH